MLGATFIEFQSRWKDLRRIDFHEIQSIGDFVIYDHIIEICTETETYLIERNYMENNDFHIVLNTLNKAVDSGQILLTEPIKSNIGAK